MSFGVNLRPHPQSRSCMRSGPRRVPPAADLQGVEHLQQVPARHLRARAQLLIDVLQPGPVLEAL
eukprot:7301333-Pyramimonas_sp.AAC.1